MSRKPAEAKTRPDIAEAVQRTETLIRGLQTRLAEQPDEDSAEDLDRQLQKYFENHQGRDFPLNRIRRQVIEGAVEKLLAQLDSQSLEREIMDVLIERVCERLVTVRRELRELPGPGAAARTSLPA